MVKTGLSVVLVVTFIFQLFADDRCEKERPGRPNVVPVSVLLERLAKSPLGPGEANLLKAVSNLIEKEQAAGSPNSAMACPVPILAPQPTQTSPAAMAGPVEQPARLWIRLKNCPAADAGKAVEQFFNRESLESDNQWGRDAQFPIRLVLVCEPFSNSLLVSVRPRYADDLAEIISQLDARPTMVMLNVCIAKLLPRSHDGKAGHGLRDGTADEPPSMKEDGAAWLAWAKKQGRLEVLQRPQVMTLDNQPASVLVGSAAPMSRPKSDTDVPTAPFEQMEHGLFIHLTPRVSTEGSIVIDLEVKRASVVDLGDAAGRTIRRTSFQTTVSGKNGQTLVVRGLMEHADDGEQETIVAITPQINPTKR